MILIVYGTRPELIKTRPLLKVFKEKGIAYKLLFTGQHKDIESCDHDYEIFIKEGPNRLDAIVSSICSGVLDKILAEHPIDYVLIQGDTTTVLAMALSAFHHGIKIAHLEAGLRTYDDANPYPEEQNRRIVSQLADLHFCPTTKALLNLEDEKVTGQKFVTGNTVIDNLVPYKKQCSYGKKVLVTMHRRENHALLSEWFTVIDDIARHYPSYEFILPLHPNPNVQKHKHLLTHVKVVEPMDYSDILELLTECALVITDSGGLQEECSYFNKKCLVCRKVTERPEALGSSSFMVKSPYDLVPVFSDEITSVKINHICPFGQGNASDIIGDIFLAKLQN